MRAGGGGGGAAVAAPRDDATVALRRGATLIKYCRRAAPHYIVLQVTPSGDALTWIGKHGAERVIAFTAIERVVAGRHTEVFHKRRDAHEDARSVSIVYGESGAKTTRTLDLVCADEGERDVWVRGIEYFVDCARRAGVAHDDGSSRRGSANRGDANSSASTSSLTMSTAMTVARAAGKFKANARNAEVQSPSLREREGGLESRTVSSFGVAAPPSEPPSEVFLWGWRADVRGGGGTASSSAAPSGGGFAVAAPKYARVDVPSAVRGMEALDVVEVSLGARHAAARTRDGAAYTWGDGKGGKLGNPSGQDAETPVKVEIAGVARRVLTVACGSSHSVAVVEDANAALSFSQGDGAVGGGDCVVWGDPNAAPGLLGRPDTRSVMWFPGFLTFPCPAKIVQASCGPYHTACVAEDGACFTWGEGSFLALGHGERKCEPAPRMIDTFKRDGRVVLRVACGVWHTAAVVADVSSGILRVPVSSPNAGQAQDAIDGEVFTWGDGDTGKLGIAGVEEAAVPTRTSGQLGCPGSEVCDVRCGQHHTLALSAKGDVWLAGCVGKVDNSMRTKVFTRMTDFETGSVHAIASGENHVLAATRDGRVYSWGVGKNGVLGLGKNDRNQATPQEIAQLRGRIVLSLSCGPSTSACVVRAVQMTRKEKASVSRRLVHTLSVHHGRPSGANYPSNSARADVVERTNTSSADTASSSSFGTRRDGSGTGGSRAGGRSSQGLRSEKHARRLLRVLSPTYEHVAKVAPASSVSRDDVEPMRLEYRNSRSAAPGPEMGAMTTTTSTLTSMTNVVVEPVSPSADDISSDASRLNDSHVDASSAAAIDDDAHAFDDDIELARREALDAKATLARLLAEKEALELAAARAEAEARAEAAAAIKRAEARAAPAAKPQSKSPSRPSRPPVLLTHAAPKHRTIPERLRPQPSLSKSSASGNVPLGEPREWVEEVEDGVFMTLETFGDKTILKRVRFSKRMFSNQLAAQWWEENRARVLRERDLTLNDPSA